MKWFAGISVLKVGALCLLGSSLAPGCTKSEATVSPDAATPGSTEPSESASAETADAQVASPALVATYTALVHDVYARDAERCLEDQMEAEDSRYMRSAYSLKIDVAKDGSTEHVEAADVQVQVRNYEGEVLSEGNTAAMGECLTTAAAQWEFEPAPPSATRFEVSGSVGD